MSLCRRVVSLVFVWITSQCSIVHETNPSMSFLESGLLCRTSLLWPRAFRPPSPHFVPLLLRDPAHLSATVLARSVWSSSKAAAGSAAAAAAAAGDGAPHHRMPGDNDGWSARWRWRVRRIWRSVPLSVSISVAVALVALQRYRHSTTTTTTAAAEAETDTSVLKWRRHDTLHAKPWEVALYRYLPLRTISRLWGQINSVYLPVWARQPVLGWYASTFGCDMSEASSSDLNDYCNLGELFRRQLRPGVRPIDLSHELVSPVDGCVLHMSQVRSGRLEQVKGVAYSLRQFLGPISSLLYSDKSGDTVDNADWERCDLHDGRATTDSAECTCHRQLVTSSGNRLYQCVIYLAPGDYHRFHAPADWCVQVRRHFVGHLLSVSPRMARAMPALFCLNERAVYAGRWRHGFFSMTAVGATNVGSITVYCDQDLTTNKPSWLANGFYDKPLVKSSTTTTTAAAAAAAEIGSGGAVVDGGAAAAAAADRGGVCVTRGDMFGEFNMGSTIVLLFEAPADFQQKIACGTRVRLGQALGTSAI